MCPAPKSPDESTYSGRFAARLRKLREKSGLTVEELAEAMKVNGYAVAGRTIYAWEGGRNEPPLNAYPALAQSLKTKSIRELLPTK